MQVKERQGLKGSAASGSGRGQANQKRGGRPPDHGVGGVEPRVGEETARAQETLVEVPQHRAGENGDVEVIHTGNWLVVAASSLEAVKQAFNDVMLKLHACVVDEHAAKQLM